MENKNGTKQGTLKRKSAFAHMFWINLLYANPMTSSNVTGRKKFQNRERAISPLILRNCDFSIVRSYVLRDEFFCYAIVSRQLARNYNTDEPGEQFHIVFQCVL